jgi:hypothetical protein
METNKEIRIDGEIRILVRELIKDEFFALVKPAVKARAKFTAELGTEVIEIGYGVRLPLNLIISESEETGIISFTLKPKNDTGELEVTYSPQYFLENYVKSAHQKYIVEKNIEFETFMNLIIGDVRSLIRLFILNFPYEMAETANLQMLLAQRIRDFLTTEDFLQQRNKAAEKEKINEIIEYANTGRRDRILWLKERQFRSLTAPKFLFCVVYEKRWKVWKAAKKFYKSVENYKTWRNLFEAEFEKEFSDFGFPDSLIERLRHKDNSSPHELALEETAEILEVTGKKLQLRTLQEYLKESQDEKELIPDEKIEAELADFIEYKKARDSGKPRWFSMAEKQ